MRFNKSVMALAFVAAITVFGGHNAYATHTKQTQNAGSDNQAQTITNTNKSETIEVTVAGGQTLTSIASDNGTTVDALMSQNGISDANQISVGQTLKVTVDKSQDKLSNHVDQLKAAAEAFMTPPAPVVAVVTPTPTVTTAATTQRAATVSYASPASTAGNTYVWGTCTWYVKNMKPGIPNRLGNGGYGWLTTAAAAGYATGSTPVAGAVGVESGHVVVIESVNGNMVNVSEMNYGGGVGVVHYRTAPASEFMYIYA